MGQNYQLLHPVAQLSSQSCSNSLFRDTDKLRPAHCAGGAARPQPQPQPRHRHRPGLQPARHSRRQQQQDGGRGRQQQEGGSGPPPSYATAHRHQPRRHHRRTARDWPGGGQGRGRHRDNVSCSLHFTFLGFIFSLPRSFPQHFHLHLKII